MAGRAGSRCRTDRCGVCNETWSTHVTKSEPLVMSSFAACRRHIVVINQRGSRRWIVTASAPESSHGRVVAGRAHRHAVPTNLISARSLWTIPTSMCPCSSRRQTDDACRAMLAQVIVPIRNDGWRRPGYASLSWRCCGDDRVAGLRRRRPVQPQPAETPAMSSRSAESRSQAVVPAGRQAGGRPRRREIFRPPVPWDRCCSTLRTSTRAPLRYPACRIGLTSIGFEIETSDVGPFFLGMTVARTSLRCARTRGTLVRRNYAETVNRSTNACWRGDPDGRQAHLRCRAQIRI